MTLQWGASLARGLGLSFVSFGLGLLVRWPLQPVMGTKLIWLTFYPFIMVGALWGGFGAGLVTGLLSAAFAVWGWALLSPQPYVRDLADWVGVGVFLVNTGLIAVVAERLRRANLRSLEARQQAEAANRAKSVFLAQMSHELRTPFHALLGFTGLLARSHEVGPKEKEQLAVVDRNARHLLDLINNVLDMSRIEAGAEVVETKPVLIRELVSDVVELIRPRAEAKGLKLESVVGSEVPGRVWGDGRKLRQILVNLLGNAVKFSSAGTVRVGLEAASGTIRLWVEDQGPGIAPEDQATVFEPFRQLESEQAKEGTGLGLAIVRQFALALRGSVDLESTPGKGSRFTVSVPAPAASGVAETATPRQVRVPVGADLGHRFLIVDDQPDNRLLLAAIHRDLSQDFRLAEDGFGAVEAFQEWRPELIWMDVRMPKMDGPTAVRAIRQLPGGSEVKIVAVTASVFGVEVEALRGLGFDAVMTKPFPEEKVVDLMQDLLGLQFRAQESTPPPSEIVDSGLTTLNSTERLGLLDALESLDPERIDSYVFQLQKSRPAVADSVRRSIENLDYAGLRHRLLEAGAP